MAQIDPPVPAAGRLATPARLLSRVPALHAAAVQAGILLDQPAIRRAMPAILVVLAATVGLAGWLLLAEPARMPVSTGASEAEKAQMVTVLANAAIGHRIDPVTGQIEVARNDFHAARMALAAAGITQAPADGYAAIESLPLGSSRALEQTRLRQAQELELARSITEIDVVQGARVHLALSERTAFLRDARPASASVFVQIRPGRVLDPAQVQAIVNLVSAAVPGLSREAVSVIDQSGQVLSGGAGDAASMADDRDLRHRLRMEDLYRQRVESVLRPLAGVGRSAVQVTLDVDFTRSERTEERVDPNGIALRSEQTSRSESQSPEARGIPGAVTNTPPDAATLAQTPDAGMGPGERRNLSTSETRNYEVSRSVETVVQPGARIRRLHAAVLMDAPPAEDGTVAPPANAEDIRRLIESALGFEAARGDTLSLSFLPFAPDPGLVEPGWSDAPWLPDLLRQGFAVALVALIVLGVIRPLLARQATTGAPGLMTPMAGDPVGDGLIEVREGETLGALRQRLSTTGEGVQMASGFSYDEKLAITRQLVVDEGDRVAAVIGAMIRDDLDVVK